MKTLLAIITLVLATSVHASLIDIGSTGTFELALKLANNQISFADRFDPLNGFEHIGDLNGGTFFSFQLSPQGTDALFLWDFSGTPFRMRYIDILGGNGIENVYRVTGPEWIKSGSPQLVTLDGKTPIGITDVYFRGPLNSVPDTGSTAALFLSVLFLTFSSPFLKGKVIPRARKEK